METKDKSKAPETVFIVERPGEDPRVYGSIKAIYDDLSLEEIGVPLYRLWGSFKDSDTLDTGSSRIYKTTIKRSKRNGK